MQFNLFDEYTPGEITEAISNWVVIWEEIAINLSYNPYELFFTSPHILLLDMIEELNYNKMQFQNNWNQFKIQCDLIIGSDPVVEKFFKSEFSLLSKQLQNPKFPDYISTLCKDILKKFDDGIYFQKNHEFLKDILLNSTFSEQNKKEMLILSHNLILELFLNGYDLDTIAKMPQKIFSKYEIIGLNSGKPKQESEPPEKIPQQSIVQTDFPVTVKTETYGIDEKFNATAYFDALKQEMDQLTIETRIDTLKLFFNKEKDEGIFIFEIEGLKDNIDLTIGDVNFYSPNLKQYCFKEKNWTEHHGNPELFNKKTEDRFINAAISLSYRDIPFGKNLAINQIDKTLNILRLYVHSDIPFKILHDHFLVVKKGRIRNPISLSPEDDHAYKKMHSVDLKRYPGIFNNPWFINNLNRLFFEDPIRDDINSKNMSLSLFWFRKGSESMSNEDKLLYYWISIENLFNFSSEMVVSKKEEKLKKISIIKELAPPLIIYHDLKEISSNLLSTLWSDYNFFRISPSNPFSQVTPETSKLCQLTLKPGEIIDPKKFIETLPALRNEISVYSYTHKIDYLHNLFTDKNFAKQQIERMESQLLSEINRIYRYRNFIVHNAHSDSLILPFFTKKTERIAVTLIGSILNDMISEKDKKSFDVIFYNKTQLDQIRTKLNSGDAVNLLGLLYK